MSRRKTEALIFEHDIKCYDISAKSKFCYLLQVQLQFSSLTLISCYYEGKMSVYLKQYQIKNFVEMIQRGQAMDNVKIWDSCKRGRTDVF